MLGITAVYNRNQKWLPWDDELDMTTMGQEGTLR